MCRFDDIVIGDVMPNFTEIEPSAGRSRRPTFRDALKKPDSWAFVGFHAA
jgi:hypothetical protein